MRLVLFSAVIPSDAHVGVNVHRGVSRTGAVLALEDARGFDKGATMKIPRIPLNQSIAPMFLAIQADLCRP